MNRLVTRLLNQTRAQEINDILMARTRRKKVKEVVSKEEWLRMMKNEKIPKEVMNDLVMDFLVTECSKEAVDNFRVEANCSSNPGPMLEVRERALGLGLWFTVRGKGNSPALGLG